MRVSWQFLVIVSVTLLAAAWCSAGKPTDGMHPVVDAQRGEFFGGTVDGAWVEGDKMKPMIKGGETYGLYTLTRFVGTMTGGKAYYSEDDKEEFGALSVDLTPSKAVVDDTMLKDDEVQVAVCGEWNALPRVPKIQNATQKVYQEAVRDVLKAHGLRNEPVNITKILRVDLEGDGSEEVIIAATTQRDNFPSPEAKKNDYSLVILRKIINGKVVTIPVVENYFTRDDNTEQGDYSVPNCYTLEAVLDTNGDGVMEIITGWGYYEGIGKAIHEIKDGKAKQVLESGWGV